MENTIIIDARVLPIQQKHSTIINTLTETESGESVIIVNDHDPIPLYYQLQALFADGVEWNYLEEGPEVWQVEVKKKKAVAMLLRDILNANQATIKVFKRNNIDYCCSGKNTLMEACAKAGADLRTVQRELEQVNDQPFESSMRVSSWPIEFLVDYILFNHHNYVKEAIPEMQFLLNKVEKAHGAQYSELRLINNLFAEIVRELTNHMEKEEKFLFPAIKHFVAENEDISTGLLQEPIACMEEEHLLVGQLMDKINELTNQYTAPKDGCGTLKYVYQLLQNFEEDLHQHVHLENNVLFNRIVKPDMVASA